MMAMKKYWFAFGLGIVLLVGACRIALPAFFARAQASTILTASLSGNYTSALYLAPGTNVTYAWSSTGGVQFSSALAIYTAAGIPVASNDPCNNSSTNSWILGGASGSTAGPAAACQVGYDYIITYHAADGAGNVAVAGLNLAVTANGTPQGVNAPVITGLQGFNATTNTYSTGSNSNTALPNTYLLIYNSNNTFTSSGNTVLIDGQPATIVAATAGQINVSLNGIPTGTHTVTVIDGNGITAPSFFIIAAATGGTTTPPPACTPVTLTGSSVNPSSVATGGSYTVSCNYGVQSDAVSVVPGSGNCTLVSWSGTQANFTCTAGASAGTFSNQCKITNDASYNYCSIANSINPTTVTSGVTAPPVVPPTTPPAAPTGAAAVCSANGAAFSWTPPAGSGLTYNVAGYDRTVYGANDPGGCTNAFCDFGVSGTSVGNLSSVAGTDESMSVPGHTYEVWVQANNAAGSSALDTATYTCPSGSSAAPSAPASAMASCVVGGAASLSWTPAGSGDVYNIAGYDETLYPSGASSIPGNWCTNAFCDFGVTGTGVNNLSTIAGTNQAMAVPGHTYSVWVQTEDPNTTLTSAALTTATYSCTAPQSPQTPATPAAVGSDATVKTLSDANGVSYQVTYSYLGDGEVEAQFTYKGQSLLVAFGSASDQVAVQSGNGWKPYAYLSDLNLTEFINTLTNNLPINKTVFPGYTFETPIYYLIDVSPYYAENPANAYDITQSPISTITPGLYYLTTDASGNITAVQPIYIDPTTGVTTTGAVISAVQPTTPTTPVTIAGTAFQNEIQGMSFDDAIAAATSAGYLVYVSDDGTGEATAVIRDPSTDAVIAAISEMDD